RAVRSEGAQPDPMASVAVLQAVVREDSRAGLSARCRDRDEPAPNQATTRRFLSILHRLTSVHHLDVAPVILLLRNELVDAVRHNCYFRKQLTFVDAVVFESNS